MDAVSNTTAAATYATYKANDKKADNKSEESAENKSAVNGEAQTETPAATVEISYKNRAYPQIDRAAVDKILAQTRDQNEAFVEMLRKLFVKQGSNGVGASGLKMPETNIKDFINGLNPDQATIDKAKEAISEDGYYGVKKTTERIMSFAMAIAGDDPKAIESMRKAVQAGFGAAEKAWGDTLPDICKRTYNACMAQFDDMAKKAAAKKAGTAA